MADVLVMYKSSDIIPMVVTKEHIDKISNIASGNVYWCGNEEEAFSAKIDTEVLFIWGGSGKVPEKYCMQSQKLKWINSFSAGVDPIMKSQISKLPIKLTNAKGIHGKTMAMTTIGYIISLLRNFPIMYKKQLEHTWEKKFAKLPKETEGLTVTILGAGAIGSEVARLCKAHGMTVLGVKRKIIPLKHFDCVYSEEEKNIPLAKADIVVVLTPLTEKTRHTVNAKTFEVMKDSAFIINIARGAVIDETALIEALQNKKIAGAALDATETEPLPADSPLWDMENVIITPHNSATSERYIHRAIDQFCENLKLYEEGKELFNQIDLEKY
ncbi:D-2-hydroxyacid dehydrogenase [Clostridium sp. PL3]|uniref:D-2-hydroxyacid dehydrogenase n=1 Tax=Clostridium thailandense TaxID=2794346 RepID=A0A949U531_9CLOT|nr:D-2-hydroxyacid dehydrogenase [Clostridium thailandense]MBV7276643.1 D-2-hydroxyacid dehydrogenase [Clostridium thailandense]